MLTVIHPNWQAQITADPGYLEWMEKDEEERIAALAEEDEARHYPYGRPEHDTGWYWELR